MKGSGFMHTHSIYEKQDSRHIKFIAHRGYAQIAPQNSLKAFRKAGELNFWAIETDVHSTKDGILVCCHDGEIDSMFDGAGCIEEMKWQEIEKYRFQKDSSERMPLFSEYLAICKQYGSIPFIEVKSAPVRDILHEAFKVFAEDEIVMSSFNVEHLLAVRKLSDSVFIHHIFSNHDDMVRLGELGRAGVSYNYTDMEKVPDDLIKNTHEHGVLMCLRAADSSDLVLKMVQMGLDYIPTNLMNMNKIK